MPDVYAVPSRANDDTYNALEVTPELARYLTEMFRGMTNGRIEITVRDAQFFTVQTTHSTKMPQHFKWNKFSKQQKANELRSNRGDAA